MEFYSIQIPIKKLIALVAHDNMEDDLLEWSQYNRGPYYAMIFNPQE